MKRFLIPLLTLLWGCANVVAPTGGDKDTTAPLLVEASPPMESVRMVDRTIILKFDEYVQLKDAFNQVLISPPLDEFPDIKVRGKSIVIKLPDTLLENTTYTIQFGESIADITEGNPYSQFVYAFSTGDEIDSLYLNGVVKDVLTGAPAENILVLLYRDLADSAFQTQKPVYFAKTNDKGAFRISYIREDSYRVYALQDQNFNYFYDLPNESIAFLDTVLQIGTETPDIALDLFTEDKQALFLSDARALLPGLVRLIFNKKPESLILTESDGAQGIIVQAADDTIYRWVADLALDTQRLHIQADSLDTILSLTQKPVPEELLDSKLQTAQPAPSGNGRDRLPSQELHKPYFLTMQRPVIALDTALMSLQLDSSETAISWQMQTDSTDPSRLYISHEWIQDTSYTLSLFPGALTDLFGLRNDTIQRSFRVRSVKEYGSLQVAVIDSVGEPVILQWLNKSGELLEETHPVWDDVSFDWQLRNLLPGTYYVRAIVDLNGDGKWTTGSLEEHRQPEPLIYYPAEIQIRPDWEYELTFKIKR